MKMNENIGLMKKIFKNGFVCECELKTIVGLVEPSTLNEWEC